MVEAGCRGHWESFFQNFPLGLVVGYLLNSD